MHLWCQILGKDRLAHTPWINHRHATLGGTPRGVTTGGGTVDDAAAWNADLGEFLLPYEAVRMSDDREARLMEFLQSTYDAAADDAHWDRDSD